MQLSGTKKKYALMLDWPSEAKRKVRAEEKGTEVDSNSSTYNILLRPSP